MILPPVWLGNAVIVPAIEAFLCSWHLYLAAMSVLLGLSAGKDTWSGRAALVGAVVCAVLALSIYRPVLESPAILAANLYVTGVSVVLLAASRRNDTRQIALILAVTSALPLFLLFWSPAS
jgi:hypothetical protein